jgi:ADP-ribose pyrophosphatase
MNLKEKRLSGSLKFEGRIVKVVHDSIELPDGRQSLREVVLHPGGVCVACKDEQGDFLLVEQYRYVFQSELLEFPAGKLEHAEDPLDAAKRELIEEVGYEALEIHALGQLYPSVGYLSEVIHLYYVPKAKYIGQKLDDQEFLNVKRYPLSELSQLVLKNELKDAKTIALIHRLENFK